MQVLNKIRKSVVTIGLLAMMGQACDDPGNDIKPDGTEPAADVSMPVTAHSPVIVNLLQSSKLTGDARISIEAQPEKGSASIMNSALLKYVPDADFTSGTDRVVYKVCVGDECDEGNVEFKFEDGSSECAVTAVHDRVIARPTDQQVMVLILENDIVCEEQFDVSTLAIVEAPKHGTAEATDGLIFYYPDASFEGTSVEMVYAIATLNNPDRFAYGLVEVVLPAEDAVVAKDNTFEYSYEEFMSEIDNSYGRIYYEMNDILGDDDLGDAAYNQLAIGISQAMYGEVEYFNLEGFSYKPGAGFSGEDSFTYKVCYNDQCSEAKVTISVSDFPQQGGAIKAVDDTYTFTSAEFKELVNHNGLALSFTEIIGNDDLANIPFNLVDYSIGSQPEHGEAEYSSFELFQYFPDDENFIGADSFTYKICYNDQCSEGTITITVTE